MKVRIIQIPYTGYISASWYNREESYLEQLEVFSNCSFLIAQNMLLHLRIVQYFLSSLNPLLKTFLVYNNRVNPRTIRESREFLEIVYLIKYQPSNMTVGKIFNLYP